MIDRIVIRNFQGHRRLVIGLGGGVTSIVGETDAGKSAVLRALRWVMLNQPAGTSIVRDGSRQARVTVSERFVSVKRVRGAGKNTYSLSGGGVNGTYKAFGSAVPEPVADVFRVTEDNFQDQLDGPYWLSLTAGQLAREVNRVVDLSLIDSVLASLASRVRYAEQDAESKREDVSASRKRVRRLAGVKRADRALRLVERAERDAADARTRAGALADSLRDAVALSDRVGRLSGRLDACDAAQLKLGALADAAESARRRARDLDHDLEQALAARDAVGFITAKVEKAEEALAKIKTCPMCGSPIDVEKKSPGRDVRRRPPER